MNQSMGLLGRINQFAGNNSDALMQAGIGLIGGQTGPQQAALGMKGFADARSTAREQNAAKLQQNKTLQFLQRVNPEIAQAVAAGAISATDGYKQHVQAQTAAKPTSGLQEYQYAREQGYDGSFMDFKDANKSGVTVNMPGQPTIGTIPQGYEAVKDEAGATTMRRIPGGPEDETKFNEAKQTQEAQKATVARSAIKNIRDKTSGGVFDGNILPETGIIGNRLAQWGLNQEAVDVKSQLQTLQSVVSFDRLQAMREASPTGGALGAVSERELALLQSSLGALNQEMSEQDLMKTLDFIDGVMAKFEAYPSGAGGGEIDSLIDQYAD